MAMKLSPRDTSGEFAENSEMNVTPFIDVMLVLLIIFMVVAPLSTVNLPIDLPASSQSAGQPPDKPVIVSLAKDLKLTIGDRPVSREALGPALDAATHGDRSSMIFLQVERSVSLKDIVQLLDTFTTARYQKVSLVATATDG